MNEPLSHIPRAQIKARPEQTRKRFDNQKHLELVNSIKTHGFFDHQPLVVNQIGGAYYLVVGERRLRAAAEAGIDLIPCKIYRELSEFKARIIQLVENLHRVDLTPIEEALAYRDLKRACESDDKPEGFVEFVKTREKENKPCGPVEWLAEQAGKSRNFIYLRLLLCNLNAEHQRAVEDGKLDTTTASRIAALPDQETRDRAAKEILHPLAKTYPMDQEEARVHIKTFYTRDLRRATFDLESAELIPIEIDEAGTRVAGGSCLDCPFHTGAISKNKNPDEPADPRKGYSCLNPACFDRKEEARWERWRERETDPARKRRALTREENDHIFSGQYVHQPAPFSGYVALDEQPDLTELRPGEVNPGTWAELTRGTEPEIVVARDGKGKIRELISHEVAIEAARLNGHDIFKNGEKARVSMDERKAQEKERAQRDEEIKTNAAPKLDLLREHKVPLRDRANINNEDMVRFCLWIFERLKIHDDLLKRFKLPAGDIERTLRKRMKDAGPLAREALMVDGGFDYELDKAWLKSHGIK